MSTEVETAKKAYDDANAALRVWRRQNPGPKVVTPSNLVNAVLDAYNAWCDAKEAAEMVRIPGTWGDA